MLTPERDFRQPYDRCETCPHNWHGLDCGRPTPQNPGSVWPFGPCKCRGPWAGEVAEG